MTKQQVTPRLMASFQDRVIRWRTASTGLVVFLVALALGLITALRPTVGTILDICVVLAAVSLMIWRRLPVLTFGLIGISLAGYAVLGKGYAYMGVPPIFIGEISLLLGLIALWLMGGTGVRQHRWIFGLLGLLVLVGMLSTLPYVNVYGFNAFRDAVAWVYALFAFIMAGLVIRLGYFERLLFLYSRWIPWFLVLALLCMLAYRLFTHSIPEWPLSGVPIIFPKGGDIAVHLAGILVFVVLGLHQQFGAYRPAVTREWIWWVLWVLVAGTVLTGRAALLAILAGVVVAVLFKPLSRWRKLLYVVALVLTCLVAFDIRVNLGTQRDVSVEGLLLNIQGITGDSGTATRDGSRTWRINWWKDIAGYTIEGPYFWTGKGFGINLADADGYQVYQDHSLRNPHSVHMMFLARAGVPGLLAWAAVQIAFAVSLLLAYFRARASGFGLWSRIYLWILAYWLAFIVNASFDVYLEGPQGGIWFWCLFGFGVAALELGRRQMNAELAQRSL